MNKQKIIKLFENTGIKINGINSWDIQVHNDVFYENFLYNQTIGLAKSYTSNIWSCSNLSGMLNKYISLNFLDYFGNGFILSNLDYVIFNVKKLIYNNLQYIETPFLINCNQIDNDLYKIMLDPYMCYTSGHWNQEIADLNQAQINAMEMICRNLEIRPNMNCLIISNRYTSFGSYLAKIHLMESYTCISNINLDNINHNQVKIIPFNEIEKYSPYDRIIWVSDLDYEPGCCEYVHTLIGFLKRNGQLLYQYLDFLYNYSDEFLRYATHLFGNKNIIETKYRRSSYSYSYSCSSNLDYINYCKTISSWTSKIDQNYDQLSQIYNYKFLRLYYFYLNYMNALLINNKIVSVSRVFKVN